MDTEEQNRSRDKYKETELKYKRYDLLARWLGAFAAIASATVAFSATRGYTRFPGFTSQSSPTAPVVSPSVPAKASIAAPVRASSTPSPIADDDRNEVDDD